MCLREFWKFDISVALTIVWKSRLLGELVAENNVEKKSIKQVCKKKTLATLQLFYTSASTHLKEKNWIENNVIDLTAYYVEEKWSHHKIKVCNMSRKTDITMNF